MGLRVLIVAISYFPMRIPSDKQFVNDLLKHLPDSIEPAVWTLNEADPSSRIVRIGNRNIPVRSICRLWHRPLSSGEDGLVPHPNHSQVWNLTEISLSLGFAAFGSLRKAIRDHKAQILHFADHIGPVLQLIRALFPDIAITCAKPTAWVPSAKYWLLYERLLQSSLGSADAIIAYSQSCKSSLVHAGIDNRKLHMIPWGIERPCPTSQEKINLIRQRYGCSPDDLLVVGEDRGLLTEYRYRIIRDAKVLAEQEPMRFVFPIRPTRFQEEHTKLSDERVTVIKSPPDFYDLLAAADALFCPEGSQLATCLPPLMWLEAMVRRTPVVTTFGPGVEETLVDGQTGILYQDSREAADALRRLMDKELLAALQNGAQRFVLEKYDVERIAESYAELWTGIWASRRTRK